MDFSLECLLCECFVLKRLLVCTLLSHESVSPERRGVVHIVQLSQQLFLWFTDAVVCTLLTELSSGVFAVEADALIVGLVQSDVMQQTGW